MFAGQIFLYIVISTYMRNSNIIHQNANVNVTNFTHYFVI